MIKRKVKFCPKCKSADVATDYSAPSMTTWMIVGGPIWYKCNNCGFRSQIFPEKESKKEKIKNVPAKT